MDRPLISVVIPVYNSSKYIERAIKSVVRQDVSLEIIAVEDASVYSSKSIFDKYSGEYDIKYIENKTNLGVAESRNKGVQMAKGEYIAFLDADDWWQGDKLKKQLALIKKKDTPFVYSGRELMSEDGEPLDKIVSVPTSTSYEELLKGNIIPASSVLIKSEVAKEFPQHDDDLHEDYIMWLEILREYSKVYGIDEPLLKSRMSEGGKSRNKTKSAMMTWGVYKMMGIGFFKRCYYFMCYALNGIKKYR